MATITEPEKTNTTSGQPAGSRRWPLWGLAAGVLGAIATIFTNVTAGPEPVGPEALKNLSGATYHVGGALGYVAVACLLAFAGCWRARVTHVMPASAAARVVADGFVISAAGLALGYGWKLAMALYLPGGVDKNALGDEAKFVYFVLNDFGAFIGWLGVVIAAGAIAWLGLRDKVVATWLAVLSIVPVLAVLVMSLGLSVAGYPGIVGPVWLILAGAALTFGRHRIIGTR
ncbi:MAG: hypothetical protein ACRDV3_13095 [Acidothermaceae bacterium]